MFDVYCPPSIKGSERRRRSRKSKQIDISITSESQKLPVYMNMFLGSSINKEHFQQFFVKWIKEKYEGSKPIFLGGGSDGHPTLCYRIQNKTINNIVELACTHEEADDRVIFHVNYKVNQREVQSITLASSDTDIFICLLYHLIKWREAGLKFLWL